MSSKFPPVPPENQSHKGPGDPKSEAPLATSRHLKGGPPNPDQQGHQANKKINTTHQGYQQDR